MLLMKHLMDREVGGYFGVNIVDFPIRENANIVRGNALRLDWGEVCPAQDLNYIFGNPPFVGYSNQTKEQKKDVLSVYVDSDGKTFKTAGKMILSLPGFASQQI